MMYDKSVSGRAFWRPGHPRRGSRTGLAALILMFSAAWGLAQISAGGTPPSFSIKTLAQDIPTVVMPDVNVAKLLVEDELERKMGLPFRFGFPFDVDLGLDNAGTWEQLPDGSMLWRLRIVCPGAYSINLIYDEYRVPEGARLFLYDEGRAQVWGAFTHRNHKVGGRFATSPVKGAACILEYVEPPTVREPGRIRIGRVIHGYKDVFYGRADKGFGDSGSCNNNVACPEGAPWALQIRSVAMIITGGGSRLCSGSLVNNVRQDQTPYFLTANHCYEAWGGQDVTTWVFWFNYQSATCANPATEPPADSMTGSILRAANAESDFCLVELSSAIPTSYSVFYNGWSNRNVAATSAVGIHHPSGDIKKISFDDDPLTSTAYLTEPVVPDANHWRVGQWEDGTTEGGSSGSPIFDQNHRVVGQLHGGYASCTSLTSDWYGKFSTSWDYGSTAATRLRDWLDPDNTGAETLDGREQTPAPNLSVTGQTVTDTCSGKSGGDGILEAGEHVTLAVTVANSGSLDATGVTGTIACNDPYVILNQSATTFPDITAGHSAANNPPDFAFSLAPDTPCGHAFDVVLTLTDDAAGVWDHTFSLAVGDLFDVFLLDEDFETWPPAGWQVVDNGGDCVWDSNANIGRSNNTPGSGNCAAADSDRCGSGTSMDTDLLSPVFSLAGITLAPRLEYHYDFNYYSSSFYDYGAVDITVNNGATWTNLATYAETDTTGHEVIDLSPWLGESQVQLRFHYEGAYDWWFQVDNVQVLYSGCEQDICAAWPGDLNEDGQVNAVDASLLANYLAGNDVPGFTAPLSRADLNDDTFIDATDLALLLLELVS